MCRLTRSLLVVALWLAVIPAAQAQTVGLKPLWTVPGVTNDVAGTVINCTNGSTASQSIAVDVYGAAGAFITAHSITAAPNAAVVFATDAIPSVPLDVNLNVGILSRGHARVRAAGKGLLCTAYLVLASNGQPITSLTIAAKLK